jgi:hypothetical protein
MYKFLYKNNLFFIYFTIYKYYMFKKFKLLYIVTSPLSYQTTKLTTKIEILETKILNIKGN